MTPTPPEAPSTLRSIQYLRGVAALMVVLFHAADWTGLNFDIGMAGVDLFFVISGFVIWTVTAKLRRPDVGDFALRRAIRVAPPYWLATSVAALMVAFLPSSFPAQEASFSHVAQSLLFIPHFGPDGRPFPILTPGWTLPYEALFYLLFAAFLPLEPKARVWMVTLALLLVTGLGFLSPTVAYPLIANPLLMEFAAGMWLARILPRVEKGFVVGLLALVVGAGAYAAMHFAAYDPDLWRPLLWGVPAVLIVGGLLAVESAGRLPRLPGLATLGEASYALYLTHFLVLVLVARVIWTGDRALFIAAGVAASLAVGLLSWRYVERPMLDALRRRFA